MKPRNDLQGGILRARRRGMVVIEPRANQLQLDLDGARSVRRYGMQFAILRRAGLTRRWRERIVQSKRRGHVHVTITIPEKKSIQDRIALQAILGSDPIREAFNWCRAARGGKYPIVFFEKEKK